MVSADLNKASTISSAGMLDLPTEDIFGNAKKLAYVLDRIEEHRTRIGRPLRVLDFGCGNATAVGQYLARTGVDYTGVDFHEPSLAYARTHFSGPNVRFCDAVPDGAVYDVIVYADVIEHLPDPLAVVASHVPHLAPGGIVIGSVPNGYGPCEVEKFVDRHLRLYKMLRFVKRSAVSILGREAARPPAIPYNIECGHVMFFTLGQLQRMVADAGLRIADFAHGGFVGADLTANTIFRSRRFVDWNVRVADRLPAWAVSTWYFVLTRR
jgi:SAM-dependent methyltransferase